MDWKLEVVVLPVSDVDRAKEFYTEKLGFNLDVDHEMNEHFRIVQMTPPGSGCSVTVGKGLSDAAPGSVRGMQLVVSDIEAAHAQLTERGVPVSEISHFDNGNRKPGVDPDRRVFNSFIFFSDPDGNAWAVQEGHRGTPPS
ncbi:MAG TPA: glyoxalase superfamily protein [Jatrophihabitans sp.]|jgi:catechol 2,3-dioxygenase-like lactoylglutathione lyase family enzyme|uniref:glyoxalase superfamily protein n=1 Tax=Jatrophihabitans sp. TaxID=1932789 RepID=UPI002EE69199